MVAQALRLLFAGLGGPAAMADRRGDADREVLAGRGRLTGAGLAADGR